jgi:hypothetical protein
MSKKQGNEQLLTLDRQKIIFSLAESQAVWLRSRFKLRGERSAWIRDAIEIKRALEDGKAVISYKPIKVS